MSQKFIIPPRETASGNELRKFFLVVCQSINNILNNFVEKPSSKLISTTHDVSVTGTQAITGVGFTPSGGVIWMTIDSTEGASWGMFDSSMAIGSLIVNRAGDAGVYEPYTAMYHYNADGTATCAFTITSLDTDGLTITWAKVGTPTGTATIKFLLFK